MLGFTDIYIHPDYTRPAYRRTVSELLQRVMIEALGNCGFGCAPILDAPLAAASMHGFDGSVPLAWLDVEGYLQRLAAAQPAVNVLRVVPSGQLRRAILGFADQTAAPDELGHVQRLLLKKRL